MKKLFVLLVACTIIFTCTSCDISKPSRPTSYANLSMSDLIHDVTIDYNEACDKYVNNNFVIFARIEYLSNGGKSFSAHPINLISDNRISDTTIQIVGSLEELPSEQKSLLATDTQLMFKGTIVEMEYNSPNYIKIKLKVYEIAEW